MSNIELSGSLPPPAPEAEIYPVNTGILKLYRDCNMACTYCFVYRGADTVSLEGQPDRMGLDVVGAVARSLSWHSAEHGLSRVNIVLHGGEPLLGGAAGLRNVAETVQESFDNPATSLTMSMQTDGLLLTREGVLDVIKEFDIKTGVSIDGDKQANVRRVTRNGRETYDDVVENIIALSEHCPDQYSGLLAVINPDSDPEAAYEALAALRPKTIDFMLPDNNWNNPPKGHDPTGERTPYGDYLLRVEGRRERDIQSGLPAPRIRIIDSVRNPETTDTEAAGLYAIKAFTVWPNGNVGEEDTMMSVGVISTGLNVMTPGFDLNQVAALPQMRARQEPFQSLADECKQCPIVLNCGGGQYAHRFKDGDPNNISVYCGDMIALTGGSADFVPDFNDMPAPPREVAPVPLRKAVPVLRGIGRFAAFSEQNRASGEFVYHGTTEPFEELVPHMPVWEWQGQKYPDSDVEIISAQEDPLIAVFMALRPRAYKGSGFQPNERGGITIHLPRAARRDFGLATGVVGAVPRENLIEINLDAPSGWPGPEALKKRVPELRSPESERPRHYFEVSQTDFIGMLAIRPECELVYTG